MAGTTEGGIKARNTILAKKPNHYQEIGAKGGRNGHSGGFAANPALARVAGAKGGSISRRRPSAKKEPILATVVAEKQQKQLAKPKRNIFTEIRDMFL